MPTFDILKKQTGPDINLHLPFLNLANYNPVFLVQATFDDAAFKEIRRDVILQQKFKDEALIHYKEYVEKVKTQQRKYNTYAGQEQTVEGKVRVTNDLSKIMYDTQTILQESAKRGVLKVWGTYCQKKKEYTKYKIGIVTKVTGQVAVLYTSVGLIASTPFTAGIGTAAGIVGAVKTALLILKEIQSAAMEVEQAEKKLKEHIYALRARARKEVAGIKMVKAGEYAGDLAKAFLGFCWTTIGECNKELEVVNQKVNGIEIQLHELSKRLNKVLEKRDVLYQEVVKEVRKRCADTWSHEASQIEIAFDKVGARVTHSIEGGITTVMEMHDRVELAQAYAQALQIAMREFQQYRTTGNKVVAIVAQLAATAAEGITGSFHGIELSREAAEVIQVVTPVAVEFVWDKFCALIFKGSVLE